MTTREYLSQAYRLDQRIQMETMEAARLRDMAYSITAVSNDLGKVQTSQNTDAPFVKALEQLDEQTKQMAAELEKLTSLKRQINETILTVSDTREQMLLRLYFVHQKSWEEIGEQFCADRTTVYRWCMKAVDHVKMPEDPIVI